MTKTKVSSIKIKKELITIYLKEKKLTKKEFCKINNIDYNSFKKVLRGEFRLLTYYKLSLALNIDLEDLFDQ